MNALPSSFTAGVDALRQTGAPEIGKAANLESVRKTAKEFEAFFLTQMMEYMFEGIATDGPFGGGFSEGIFRSFMLQEYGKTLANAGGFGLGDAVMKEILTLQEVQ
jgi:Rod binding domain-containing protein